MDVLLQLDAVEGGEGIGEYRSDTGDFLAVFVFMNSSYRRYMLIFIDLESSLVSSSSAVQRRGGVDGAWLEPGENAETVSTTKSNTSSD